MSTDGYQVGPNLLRQLSEMRRQVQVLWNRIEVMPTGEAIFRRHVGKVSGTITAATDGGGERTAGSGTVTLYRLNLDTTKYVAITDGAGADVTVTAYNWTTTASGTDAYVRVEQDPDGTWEFVNEAC